MTRLALLLLAVASNLAASFAQQQPPAPQPTPAPAPSPAPPPAPKSDAEKSKSAVAIVVNADNPVNELTLDELRQVLRLDRQFWDDKLRVVLVARPTAEPEQQLLLDVVYAMDDKELRRLFVGKLYAGRIPAIPTVVKSGAAAAKIVAQTAGAVAAVSAADLPKGVKVLAIDGKRPGDAGYALARK
jgi:ABC-type phosphate transport system substrate-binding protein